MLVIREDQMTMRIMEEEGFVNWYVNDFMPEHLAEFHESLSNEDLHRMVRNGRKEAIANGFNEPASQVHFVTLMWKIGPNFHHFPGFREIAQAKEQQEATRIDRFYNEVTSDQAADAILGANDRYWFPETMNRVITR